MYTLLMTNNNIKNFCANFVQFRDIEALCYGSTLFKSWVFDSTSLVLENFTPCVYRRMNTENTANRNDRRKQG